MIRALSVVFGLLTATAAHSDQCGHYDLVRHWLSDQFKESRQDMMYRNGGVLEFWGNHNTGTWTIIEVLPSGVACMILSGAYWNGQFSLLGEPT